MNWVDSHCHLFLPPLGDDLHAVLLRARQAQVQQMIVAAYDLASWSAIAQLRPQRGVSVALGLHPWVADQELSIDALQQQISDNHACAIGEIGLDGAIDQVPMDRQISVLKSQLSLAHDLDLPVILHCRKAFDLLQKLLRPYGPGLRGVLHAFSRGPELGQIFIDLGLHLGFGGAITQPKATRARRSARQLPLERILLETDAPSIGTACHPAPDVEPAHVVEVGASLAALRGLSLAQVADATRANSQQLFGLAPESEPHV